MRNLIGAVAIGFLLATCGGSGVSPPDSNTATTASTSARQPATSSTADAGDVSAVTFGWSEDEVEFPFDGEELFGILTWPAKDGPHPTILLLSGSGDETGVRSGASERVFVEHSRKLAARGFAVLRYDPPGVGRSSGEILLPSLDQRVEETHAAIEYLQSLADIADDAIGLQGWSQGPWVMAMTAVRYPDEVAFLVSVVGSGQSVAHQQVYGIKAQSQAAGLSDVDVTRAVVFGRLLIDWQLPEPIFESENRADLMSMGDGPWVAFAALAYESNELTGAEEVTRAIEIFETVRTEPWAEALILDLFLARLRNFPADIDAADVATFQTSMARVLLTDPKDFLTKVRIPLLALFGETDINVDTGKSARLFETYLTEAGNRDFTIVVFPDAGHDIGLATPNYWDTLAAWLTVRFGT